VGSVRVGKDFGDVGNQFHACASAGIFFEPPAVERQGERLWLNRSGLTVFIAKRDAVVEANRLWEPLALRGQHDAGPQRTVLDFVPSLSLPPMLLHRATHLRIERWMPARG